MVTVSVVFLLLSAFSPPVHSRLTTFHLIKEKMNQTEARATCREKYTDLVTVYCDEDSTELYNMMMKADVSNAWIGLYRGEKWSNGDPVTFRNLTGVCGTSTFCAAVKPDGSWESLQCTGMRYFMCYEQAASSQTPNYHLIRENKTWYEAQSYCRGKYTDLVSIRQQQNEEVKIKGLNSSTPFWIGLLCDDWQWADGGNSTYRNWESGEPQQSPPHNCVELKKGGKWHPVPCSNKNHYALCYSTFSPPVHSRLTTFHLIKDEMNQTEARAACREKYTDLVTVYCDEDHTELYNMMMKADVSNAWIGLYRGEKWSNGDPVTFRDLTVECGTSSFCAAVKADGAWESLQCTEKKHFMCYEQAASSQTPNYHLIRENKTWYEAQRYCRGKYTDLVSIRHQQQNEEVKIKGLNSSTPFWIGLLCDDWQWTDGNSAYRNWTSGEPQQSPPHNCVALKKGGKWHPVQCSSNHSALCYNTSIHVSDVALNWEEALDYCDKGNRAGFWQIESKDEQEELEFELKRRRVSEPVWVGLRQSQLFGFWIWVDGKAVFPYANWDEGKQPEHQLSQHCGAVVPEKQYRWKDMNCQARYRALCHIKCSP